MTKAQFITNANSLTSAISVGDVVASDLKTNSPSGIKAAAVNLVIALADLVRQAGLGARYQSTARVNTNDISV